MMKKITITLLQLLLLFNSYSQGTKEIKIRELENELKAAHLKRDTIVLYKLLSPGYVVNTPGNKVATMEDIKTNLRKPGGDTLSFERNIEKITFTNNIAIVMGQEIRIIGGKTDKRRYTNIWMNKGNNWQLVARQATVFLIE
jgi:hypothetical protein